MSSQPALTSRAANHALSISEIFELILTHVPLQQLLVSCLRVSRAWHDFISNSTTFQRALFFKPGTYPDASRKEDLDPGVPDPGVPDDGDYILNPFLDYAFPTWFNAPGMCLTGGDSQPTKRFLSLPWSQHPGVWRRADASWRRMEIAQPRICQIHVRAYYPDFDIRFGVAVFPEEDRLNGQGITVGELYDFLEKEVLRGDESCQPTFQIRVWRLPWFGGESAVNIELDYLEDKYQLEEPLPWFMSEGFSDFGVYMVKEDVEG